MKNILLLLVLLVLIISSCGTNHLFDKKYMRGVVIANPVTSGEFGQIEMHQGNNIEDSYLALYKDENFNIGDSVYFKVKSVEGIPVAYDLTDHSHHELYNATPKTNMNYHSFEVEGREHGWHRVGHMVIESLTQQSSGEYKIKIWSTGGVVKEFTLDESLIDMASLINESETTDYYGPIMTRYRVFYGLEENKIMALDTFHRHGNVIVDRGGRPR